VSINAWVSLDEAWKATDFRYVGGGRRPNCEAHAGVWPTRKSCQQLGDIPSGLRPSYPEDVWLEGSILEEDPSKGEL